MRRISATLLLSLGLLAAAPPSTWSSGGMVSSDHKLAAAIGAEVLSAGGNAADAVVATALAAGVAQPAGSGLGGGGFAVLGSSGEEAMESLTVIDFREIAPAASHPRIFQDENGEVVPGLSTKGGLAVGVPGEGRGLAQLVREHGALTLQQVAEGAARLAEEGFIPGAHLIRAFERNPLQGLFLNGTPTRGARVLRPRLGATIRAWAATEGEALNVGPIAEEIASTVQESGGVLTAQDLADYQPTVREPLVGSYRGYTVVTMPPPSSGGVVLLQALAVLEQHDLAALGHGSSEHLHLLAETFKHAYADRAAHMGDPAFVEVPVERLLSDERIAEVSAAFDPERTLPLEAYGELIAPTPDDGTHHISVLDANGMAASLTTTINTSFGSEVVTPNSGLLLNNEMDDFISKPGVPNAFGLVGREANQVEPGKKPLSSMTPTILYRDGSPAIVVGGSGGPFIISSTLQAISNVVDFGMSPEEALSAPRMHHQWVPELLFVDEGTPRDVIANLESRGHTIREMPFFSAVQLIQRTDEGLFGAADPRKGGGAAAAEAR